MINIGQIVFNYGPLVIVLIVYIVPLIVGYKLFQAHKNIPTATKVVWYIILLLSNFLGLIGLYTYLSTKK